MTDPIFGKRKCVKEFKESLLFITPFSTTFLNVRILSLPCLYITESIPPFPFVAIICVEYDIIIFPIPAR